MAITDEQLTLDLRPLAAGQPVRVEATYHLCNSGPARHADLLFVSATAVLKDFEVRLGDCPVESRPLSPEEFRQYQEGLPADWKPPHNVPGIDWPETWCHFDTDPDEFTLLAFSVELPAGASTLAARYRAHACGTDENHPTVTWQFPYVLAPARRWGGFGRLGVTAILPPGWQSASTPTLKREGDVLRGWFDHLPANVLVVAARAPVGPELERAAILAWVLYALALLAGGLLCWGVGHWYGQIESRRGAVWGDVHVRATLLAVLMGMAWAGLLYGATRLAVWGIFASLGGQESPYFHERTDPAWCGSVLLMLTVLPAGLLLTRGAAQRAMARVEREAEQ